MLCQKGLANYSIMFYSCFTQSHYLFWFHGFRESYELELFLDKKFIHPAMQCLCIVVHVARYSYCTHVLVIVQTKQYQIWQPHCDKMVTGKLHAVCLSKNKKTTKTNLLLFCLHMDLTHDSHLSKHWQALCEGSVFCMFLPISLFFPLCRAGPVGRTRHTCSHFQPIFQLLI